MPKGRKAGVNSRKKKIKNQNNGQEKLTKYFFKEENKQIETKTPTKVKKKKNKKKIRLSNLKEEVFGISLKCLSRR